MEFIIVIIIFVVISLISAAAKKKPSSNAEDEYVRPTLSDIQRAFMMSSEMESSTAASRPEPVFSQSAVTEPASPSYAPEEYSIQPAQPVSAFQAPNRYASIDLATFHTESAEAAETPKKAVRQHKSSLKLFENKNDFVRAVIYSEILTRKGH